MELYIYNGKQAFIACTLAVPNIYALTTYVHSIIKRLSNRINVYITYAISNIYIFYATMSLK